MTTTRKIAPPLLNKHPVDPEWDAEVRRLSRVAARRLGCMVLLCAIQDGETGKLVVSVEGAPKSGPLAEIAAGGNAHLLRAIVDAMVYADYIAGSS